MSFTRILIAILGISLATAAEATAEHAHIDFSDCTVDNGYVAPVAASLAGLDLDPGRKARFAAQMAAITHWPPVQAVDAHTRIVAWLTIAALVDMSRGEFEGEVAYAAFADLRQTVPVPALTAATTDIVLDRFAFAATGSIPSAGLDLGYRERDVHVRVQLYAKKLLGRLLGVLPVHR